MSSDSQPAEQDAIRQFANKGLSLADAKRALIRHKGLIVAFFAGIVVSWWLCGGMYRYETFKTGHSRIIRINRLTGKATTVYPEIKRLPEGGVYHDFYP